MEHVLTASPAPLLLIANLKGGIGNQLFQYVAAASLAGQMGARLACDTSFFDADPYGNQAAVARFAPEAAIARVAEAAGPGAYLLRDDQVGAWQDRIALPEDARVLVTDGYWQREALLNPAVVARTYGDLSKAMQPVRDSPLGRELAAQGDAVAVHLRRRDYAHLGICEESYYLGALAGLKERYARMRLYVFSDEPNYARHVLDGKFADTTFVASGGDLSDLYLMSLCTHFVIANSTYSWWAAFFGERKGGLVVCPKEWITMPGVASPCPERWIHVDHAVRAPTVDPSAVARAEHGVAQQMRERSAEAAY